MWYNGAAGAALLAPLETLYKAYVSRKRQRYLNGQQQSYRSPVPVVVVGNLVVGGAGKTPLVLAICDRLQQAGMRPGILSRGYQARAEIFPRAVLPSDDAIEVGDEPLLMAQRSGAPVCIDPQRARGARWLVEQAGCDIVLCDDGLQHYALARDVEVAVIDAQRELGNGRCLPAGPLREPAERLHDVDLVVYNGADNAKQNDAATFTMHLKPSLLVRLHDNQTTNVRELAELASAGPVHAVTGIGNPQRFFASLGELGFEIIEHSFGDHHPFSAADLQFDDERTIIMTEKDAVKCRDFAPPQAWYLPVDAQLEEGFYSALLGKIERSVEQLQ
ncbi:MAG: tetraacyldisaccharide 4'-kinase [Pseudomonadales bacterium]